MKHSAMIASPEKRSPTFLVAGLLILTFSLASFAAIMLIEAQKVPTLDNNTAWLESYFTKHQSKGLSEKQKEIIHNSAAIVSSIAQDAGVTVTLQSVCGNGYITYCKVDVELPESMNAGQGSVFERSDLIFNEVGFGGSSLRYQTIEDDNPTDNRFSLLIEKRLYYYQGLDYSFNNGIVHTLHLKNIKIEDESGTQLNTIEGQWDFRILFNDEGKVVNLIQEPVVVRGFDFWEGKYFEAEIKSFALTEFSAYCEYKPMPISQEIVIGLRPVVIMKDGRTVLMESNGGGGSMDSCKTAYELKVPISLDEVAFVKLSDEVVLPVQMIKK